MQAVVQKWGNSLGFRIPSLWAKDNNVKNGSKIEVIAEKGKMIILPQKKSLDFHRIFDFVHRKKSEMEKHRYHDFCVRTFIFGN